MSSLEQFVRTACAEEVGLQVKKAGTKGIQFQPQWPLDRKNRAASKDRALDLSEEQVVALMAYIRSLPAPLQILPESFEDRLVVDAGRERFGELGCAVCHVEDVGEAKGVFSDFLLHRMGSEMADRVGAPFPPSQFRRVTSFRTAGAVIRGSSGGGGGYAGGGGSTSTVSLGAIPSTQVIEIPPSLGELRAATEEFRTAPLWGVADSAPYLHDGRAESLDEAIRLHDGQGRASADDYAALDEEARGELLAFLETLKAPVED